jgi:hypothetical protein
MKDGILNLDNIIELYQLVSKGIESIESRKQFIILRKKSLNKKINKFAFDTRRINQEIEYNPRRGLQNYHRSEQFISQATSEKLTVLAKLKRILDSLKDKYGKEPEWQDSYSRILLNTINNGLRTEQKDGDYTDSQRAVGSLDYIEELLDMRYRLNLDGISKMADEKIKGILLSKDEDLTYKDLNRELENVINKEPEVKKEIEKPEVKKEIEEPRITRHDVATQKYDTLLDKIFEGVNKTSKENKNVERSITITIRDSYLDKEEKKEKDKE